MTLGKEGKKQFMHAPHKVVVDLANTKTAPVLARTSAQLVPAPALTVAECVGFTMDQQFDITALVRDVSETRPGGMAQGRPRVVADVTLVDGTGGSDGVAQPVTTGMIVTMFADAPQATQQPSILTMLRQARNERSAVTFSAWAAGARRTKSMHSRAPGTSSQCC